METKIKRCPFRRDDEGFAPCYGKECMAYMEYDATPYNPFCTVNEQQTPKYVSLCRMMLYPAYHGGGCAN